MRIGSAHAIDFRALARRKFLLGIETPASFEQALTPQYLMDARNTSLKIVGGIEDGGIRIRDLLRQRQQFAGNRVGMSLGKGEVKKLKSPPPRPNPQETPKHLEAAEGQSKTK